MMRFFGASSLSKVKPVSPVVAPDANGTISDNIRERIKVESEGVRAAVNRLEDTVRDVLKEHERIMRR